MHILCELHCRGLTGARQKPAAGGGGGGGGREWCGRGMKLAAVDAAAYLVQGDGGAQLVSFNLAAGNVLLQRQYLLTRM